jgi:AP-3 complex subunit beta
LLRQNEEDALPAVPSPQAISSASSTAPKTLGSAGVTPIVLTPTGSSTPVREAKETWRDLDKFYASGSDKKNSESSSEEESEENLEEDNGAYDSEEAQDDTADYESSEEDGQEGTDGSSAKIQQ